MITTMVSIGQAAAGGSRMLSDRTAVRREAQELATVHSSRVGPLTIPSSCASYGAVTSRVLGRNRPSESHAPGGEDPCSHGDDLAAPERQVSSRRSVGGFVAGAHRVREEER